MKIFRKRWFVASIGLLLVGVLIWFAGPYLAFADYHPFAPAWVRIGLIALIVLFYVGRLLWKKFKAMQAGASLAAAVSRPATATAGAADTEQLRQRFDEAIAQLKKDKKRVNLYELPWYVIIGAPGAGKTTVLRNSGLHFPLEQKFGREAMRGVGGTRNCDWWFTNEAVLLDTAGRYTTQDSDQAADNAGWKAFLALLVKYRKRRPLNGVILALSAADLLTQHTGEREQHIAALARRLDELERELRVRLPVYVLVTKTDLVAGFSEYFEDLALKERTQVWGVTFPYAKSSADGAAEKFPAEFSSLVRRLNERVMERVENERDPRRKQAIFGFPQQWSTLGESLQAYLRGLFASGRPGGAPMLRGVYFTSGTQEGNPIDRILGAVGRNLPQEAVLAPAAGAGKAYFIERLLREVMFAESGLAGVNRAAERRGLLLQIGTLAAAALFALLGITVLAVSYARNKAYVAEVDTAVRAIDASAAPSTLSLDQGLPRLDALQKLVVLASRRDEGAPLSMRWGLYRGSALGSQARDAYLRELNGFLLPKMASAIQSRLIAYTAEPDKLYEYLKAYIMLGQPEHMDPAQLESLLDIEWATAFQDRPEVQRALSGHVKELLQARGGLRAMAIDEDLVRRARIAIRQASVSKLIFSALKLQYTGTPGGVRIGDALGIGYDKVLVRASGKPLDEEISALYTPTVFDEVKLLGSRELVLRFAGESWVLGEDAISVASSEQIGNEVMGLYEDSYIATWDAVVKDFKVAPFRTVDELRNGLAIIAGPTSPLRALLQLVDRNTQLIKPAKAEAPSAADKAQAAVKNRLDKLLSAGNKATGAPATAPRGTKVTQYFADLHRYVDASAGPAPIDRHLALIGQVQQRLQSVGTGLGEVNPLEAVVQSGSGDAVKALKQEAATLPPVLADLVNQVSQQSTTVAMGQARNELVNLYQTDVVAKCSAIANGRFPFQPAGTSDVPLADFGRLFGTSGIFDTFYQQHLQALVDSSRSPWRWKGGDAGSLGLSAAILRQFELAQKIREVYFRPGGQIPEVRFTVTADSLDAAATRVTLEIDGQSVDYRHGPVRAVPIVWPGPAPGTAAISFEDRSGTRPNIVTNGPWALFRLIGRGSVQSQSEVRYFTSWSAGTHDAKFLVEASSISNPFSGDLLRQFSCGA